MSLYKFYLFSQMKAVPQELDFDQNHDLLLNLLLLVDKLVKFSNLFLFFVEICS